MRRLYSWLAISAVAIGVALSGYLAVSVPTEVARPDEARTAQTVRAQDETRQVQPAVDPILPSPDFVMRGSTPTPSPSEGVPDDLRTPAGLTVLLDSRVLRYGPDTFASAVDHIFADENRADSWASPLETEIRNAFASLPYMIDEGECKSSVCRFVLRLNPSPIHVESNVDRVIKGLVKSWEQRGILVVAYTIPKKDGVELIYFFSLTQLPHYAISLKEMLP